MRRVLEMIVSHARLLRGRQVPWYAPKVSGRFRPRFSGR